MEKMSLGMRWGLVGLALVLGTIVLLLVPAGTTPFHVGGWVILPGCLGSGLMIGGALVG
jgi:hypothetical protein